MRQRRTRRRSMVSMKCSGVKWREVKSNTVKLFGDMDMWLSSYFLFLPKQFTVGVLDSILSMSGFQLPCLPSPDFCALNCLHLSPSYGSDVRPFRISVPSIYYICLPAWVVSALFGRDVRPFRISVLSIYYVCLPAWVVMSARPFRISVLSTLCICFPARVVMSALYESLYSRLFSCVSQLG